MLGQERGDMEEEQESHVSVAAHRHCEEPEYFHMWLCEMRIHFDQTRGELEKTNQFTGVRLTVFMSHLNVVCFMMSLQVSLQSK